ncbi:glycosyltransferase family 4 protein [Mesonia sp. HuA40]|uniref:glycosyltransferase family 4 protein n=1 Tax=Mesonia sp. HuA40 TaxID=2602761 RepID=UPI0011C969CA|nr:glycosyltransferase family 4 protein [Mesonia sp. HuA40]TXK72557.1 glycosyltransferase family 4 protein [Mesonia sp. HuA40]
MKIKLISNMYPAATDKLFGVFVKKTVFALQENGATFTQKILIQGKRSSTIQKLLTYAKYYIKAIFSVFHRQHNLVYVHFLTHNLPLIFWYKQMQKKPMVLNLHGSDVSAIKPNSILDQWQNRTLKNIDALVVPSFYFKQVVQNRYPSLNIPFFVYPSGGINTGLFYPDLSKRKALQMAYVSRIDEGKGWQDFLAIYTQLNKAGINIRAVIAGDGNQKKMLLDAIAENPFKEDIDFRGFQEKEKLAEIYQQSELFIFPTELPESLGLVGLEAMACKSILFARNIGGATGYVQPGVNGFLFNSVPEVVQQIKNYLALPIDKQNQIQEKAYATAQTYETKQVAANLYANFKELCSKK